MSDQFRLNACDRRVRTFFTAICIVATVIIWHDQSVLNLGRNS
jgi:hypothetical protein